ncbi:C-Jun-amino-terminal kinase-interacting protein 1-like isoform X2 [Clinocottus analis]|uniref:C-Jun-amino-terminal kinase-interacting protein 1-like isoform X2 n=1 Tax=Clinocottus analis TaxID=304258 RepID=UPI0035BF78A0
MDKYRPKRPTTLALFPQLPQAGTQDSINNNSLGKKDSWKDSRSSSPHITGDLTPPDLQAKAEDKVQHNTRRPTPKPPTAKGANSRANAQAAANAADTRARLRERQTAGATHTQSSGTPKSQKRGGRGAPAMRERSLGDIRGKDGVTAGKDDRKGGRLCEQSRAKEKERNGHQRPRETNGLKSRGADGKGKVGAKEVNRRGALKSSNMQSNQEVYLPAMVVPRTPVAPRTEDKTQDQGQNHDRTQDHPSNLSRSSSEGGSNRMSLSSDTEGPPPGPLHPSLFHRVDPDISEEEGENDPTPCVNVQIGLTYKETTEMDCTKSEAEARGGKDRRKEEEKRRKEEEETKKRREEDVKRREEEVKRRREVVARICKQPKVTSVEESNGGRPGASRSKKFHNLFSNNSSHYSTTGAGPFGVFSCVLDGVERQQSHRAVYRFVPRHADELYLEADDPVLLLDQSEDLWCQGYNMRTGATGIFPAFYAVSMAKDINQVQKDGWIDRFMVQFLGSVQVPVHKGNDILCAAMQKVACNRRLAGQRPSACVLEVSVRGVKISVQDQCHSAHRGDQCFHFFQLKNISFCGCHPKHSKYFGIITKHPDQQRFACHVMMSEATSHPLAESVGRAFQQYYKENIGYSCPTEDIFIE